MLEVVSLNGRLSVSEISGQGQIREASSKGSLNRFFYSIYLSPKREQKIEPN